MRCCGVGAAACRMQWSTALPAVQRGKQQHSLLASQPADCRPVSVLPMACCMQVLHVGDRFSDTGNDSATRDCCSILWVANPEETGELPGVSRGSGLMALAAAWCQVSWRCCRLGVSGLMALLPAAGCFRRWRRHVPRWCCQWRGCGSSTRPVQHNAHHQPLSPLLASLTQTFSSSCCWATSGRRKRTGPPTSSERVTRQGSLVEEAAGGRAAARPGPLTAALPGTLLRAAPASLPGVPSPAHSHPGRRPAPLSHTF